MSWVKNGYAPYHIGSVEGIAETWYIAIIVKTNFFEEIKNSHLCKLEKHKRIPIIDK
ncbi:MAG: hypothetical protein E3K37_09760 [Candidatus Kuenenia sp.]|nr:hypothetical protein [Candidatus Kuenenia hertensis]